MAETVGQRLHRLRTEQALSQREVAGPGVSYAYISRIEAGARRPSVKALRVLAEKLGVSVEYLETGDERTTTDDLLAEVGGLLGGVIAGITIEYHRLAPAAEEVEIRCSADAGEARVFRSGTLTGALREALDFFGALRRIEEERARLQAAEKALRAASAA